MTNKEAIEELRDIYKEIDDVFIFTGDKKIEALDLAIKALKDVERLEEENHENFVKSQHIISMLVEEIKELRGEEE